MATAMEAYENESADRRPRATKAEMEARRRLVLERLNAGPQPMKQLFAGAECSYAQQIVVLRGLQQDGLVEAIGKDGREVLFARTIPTPAGQTPDRRVLEHLASGDDEIQIVGLHYLEDVCEIDLRFPTGEVISAQLVAS